MVNCNSSKMGLNSIAIIHGGRLGRVCHCVIHDYCTGVLFAGLLDCVVTGAVLCGRWQVAVVAGWAGWSDLWLTLAHAPVGEAGKAGRDGDCSPAGPAVWQCSIPHHHHHPNKKCLP